MKYDLTWNDKSGSIEISFAESMIEQLPTLINKIPIVKYLREELEITTDFFGAYLHNFGFEPGLWRGRIDDTIIFKATLPRYKMATCDTCKGNGKRDPIFGDEDCYVCEGSGDAPKIQWAKLLVLRANLKLLFESLNINEYNDNDIIPDMRVRLVVNKPGQHSSGMMIPLDPSRRYDSKLRFVAHHIEPLNGSFRLWNKLNRPDNLIWLCGNCHDGKRKKPEPEQDSVDQLGLWKDI